MSNVRKVLSVCEAGAPLSEWLTEARRGGRALLILGEQGAGRSAILRELQRAAVAQGVTVAETGCRGDAAEPPHLPLMHLLESLAYDAGEPAAPLQDALDKWSQNPQAWHLASRLIYPLRELARRQPILLLIDDLHRAHENLQRIALNWLVALRVEPIGLATTAATPHKSQLLRELEQVIGERAAGEVWSLRMLTREETAQRVRTMLGNPPDADALAHALHDLTGGNPLFLSEILTSLQTDTAHTPASLASLIPQSLREGILRRFEGLPKPAQDIGRALSLMDDALYPDAAQAMLGLSDGAFAKGLDALISLGWLERRADGQLAWRNRVFREVVYSTQETHERARWHERLATALEQAGAPELARLTQWRKCPPTTERLQRMRDAYLRLRAQLPPRQRLEIVDGCLHAASQLGDGNARAALLCERPYLLFQLQDGLLHALDASQQALAALEAHPDADPDRELWVQVSCARAGQLAQLGRVREAQEALQPLRDDPSLREPQRLMVELSLAYISACRGDLRAAYTIHQRVWERLQANREWLMRWGGVLRYTLQYALAFGDRALAHAALKCVESWALEPAFPERFQMLYHLMGADLAYYDGRGAEQQARARLALEMGEASGDPTAALEAWFQTLLYRQPAEAARVAERALTLVRRALGQEREAEWLTRRALALLEAGQHTQAIDAADDARRAALKIGNQWQTAKAWLIIALAHLASKRVAEAHEAIQQATPIARTLDAPELHCELRLTQAVAHLLADEADQAREAISQARAIADEWGHALYRGLAHAVDAHATGDADARAHADALLAEYGAPLLTRLLQTPATQPRRSRGWDLYMQLLGETALHYRAATMAARMWHSPRARALCASLAMQEGAPVDAFTLMEWHFPHLDADRARVNLQTTVSAARRSLRKAFGESAGDWIHYENGVYRWSPTCAWRLDVQEFESIASDALGIAQPDQQLERLNEAIRLYAGDLMPEFADEAWCSVAHQRMRVLLVECLLARAQRHYVRGDYPDAAADCERILQVDSTDEGALCLLLQIYAAQGHRAEAARLFQHTQQRARERFGHALAPTTVETFQRLFG